MGIEPAANASFRNRSRSRARARQPEHLPRRYLVARVMRQEGSMSLARYFLVQFGSGWLVTLEGRVMAQCASRTEAIESAIVMADLMGAMHYDSDVMIESEAGKPLELIWTHGTDKMPKAVKRRMRKETPRPVPRVRLVQRGEAA
jgi:hypothetical protein